MTRLVRSPVLGNGRAAEEQGEEIGEEIAGYKGRDDKNGDAERLADAEQSEIHEQKGEAVAIDAEEVHDRGDVHPL